MGSITWKRIRRGIKYPIIIGSLKGITFILSKLPRKVALNVFGALSGVAYSVVAGIRKNIIAHLTIAFGKEKSADQIQRMSKMVIKHQAWNLADYMLSTPYTTWDEFSQIIDVEGLEILQREYSKGKGVLCMINHTGSWEFSAVMPPLLGFETSAVSRRLKNPNINEIAVNNREKRGMKNISRGGAYQKLIDALAKGECVIIMIDQDTLVKGVYIDFFGKTAFTPVGLAQLALDSGAPVVPMCMMRQPNHKHLFTIHPTIPTIRTGSHDADLLENTKVYNSEIERIIRLAPEQWVWMHERWRTTPELEAKMLEKRRKKKKKADGQCK